MSSCRGPTHPVSPLVFLSLNQSRGHALIDVKQAKADLDGEQKLRYEGSDFGVWKITLRAFVLNLTFKSSVHYWYVGLCVKELTSVWTLSSVCVRKFRLDFRNLLERL